MIDCCRGRPELAIDLNNHDHFPPTPPPPPPEDSLRRLGHQSELDRLLFAGTGQEMIVIRVIRISAWPGMEPIRSFRPRKQVAPES